jgi:endonuclease/exonuclease/phosphatase family metal-dependent hydrolase
MKTVLAAALALLLSGALPASASHDIKVMTLNQYLGADFASLLTAADFNAELVRILEQIAATDFPARAERQARVVAQQKPHLVGLQEVWDLRCADLNPSDGEGCENPRIADTFVDYLDETLAALAARGAHYVDAAVVKNLDLSSIPIPPILPGVPVLPPGLPFTIDGTLAFLVAIDRDVILARKDVSATPVDFGCAKRSEDGCNYQVVLRVPLSIPPLPPIEVSFERGFVGVDATVGSKHYRFVNTHPEIREPVSRDIQCAQAAELIATLEAATTTPGVFSILVGDLNSSPDDVPVAVNPQLNLPEPCSPAEVVPPYQQLVSAGYTDVWTLRRPPDPGFTCCQAPDLLNRRSTLDERIDFIFSAEAPAKVRQTRVVGDRVSDKTPPPPPRLWPSDHAGVVAALRFEDSLAAR